MAAHDQTGPLAQGLKQFIWNEMSEAPPAVVILKQRQMDLKSSDSSGIAFNYTYSPPF